MKGLMLLLPLLAIPPAGCGSPAQSEGSVGDGQAAIGPASAAEIKPAEKPPKKPGPVKGQPAKPAVPPEKPKPAAKDSGPIYGLPLEYHFKLPEVPERIRGPTPMDQLKKTGSPAVKP